MARHHLLNQHIPLSIGKRLVVVYYPRRPHWIFLLSFPDVVPLPPFAVGWCSSPGATILGRLLLYYHRRRTLSSTNLTTSFLFHFPLVFWLLELPPALLSTVPHDESYHHHHAVRKHFSFLLPQPGDSRQIGVRRSYHQAGKIIEESVYRSLHLRYRYQYCLQLNLYASQYRLKTLPVVKKELFERARLACVLYRTLQFPSSSGRHPVSHFALSFYFFVCSPSVACYQHAEGTTKHRRRVLPRRRGLHYYTLILPF